MGSFHETVVLGNVGNTPTLRYFDGGAAVCNFSVAVNEVFGTGDERKEKVTWYRASAWNRTAEVAQQYLHKGDQVLVSGRCSASAWTDRDGNPRASLELRVDKLALIGGRNRGQEDTDLEDFAKDTLGGEVDEEGEVEETL